jgi:hypothetical protein
VLLLRRCKTRSASLRASGSDGADVCTFSCFAAAEVNEAAAAIFRFHFFFFGLKK